MDVLIEYLNDFKRKLDISEIFNFVISTELKELIIELNQDQLYDLGEDSKGNKLWSFSPSMPYSPYTIKIKQAKGQPTDRLTLRDTGAFYKSFTVEVEGTSIVLDADGQKQDTNLFSQYGIDILGLNDQNMSIFLERLTNDVIFYIKEK